MKKFIRKAVSIFAVLAVIFSLCSCTVKTSQGTKNAKKGNDGVVITKKPDAKEKGTSVISYTYKDDKGKEKKGEVNIDFEEVDNIQLTERRVLDNKKFVSDIAQKEYKMPEKEAEKAVQKDSDFKEFTFTEYIENKANKRMAFKSVSVDLNGQKDIWIKSSLDAEFTIVPGSIYPIYVSGIADMSKYDEDSLEEAFKNIKVQLEYTLVDSAQEDIDWDNVDIKVMDIH